MELSIVSGEFNPGERVIPSDSRHVRGRSGHRTRVNGKEVKSHARAEDPHERSSLMRIHLLPGGRG